MKNLDKYLTLLDGEWAMENYAIGFTKGNTELVEAVNGALAELIADGTVESIFDSYGETYMKP